MNEQARNRRNSNHISFLYPAVVLVVLLILIDAAILILNQGRFTYTLDDAYIHLALAGNIGRGHYGINPAEAAAPSSSILWPFLLAPFGSPAWGEIMPLLVNSAAALLTLYVYFKVIQQAICPCAGRRLRLFAYGLVLLLIPLTNLVGLVFGGMEHSLQLALTALLVWGLIIEADTGKVIWWLPSVIVLGPLVRYENLALSLPAVLYLVIRGHRRTALFSTVPLAAVMLLFSLFLHSQGLGFLPNSIVAKSTVLWYSGRLGQVAANLGANLFSLEGLLLSAAAILLALVFLSPKRPKAERCLAGVVITTLILQLLLGTMDGYHRYETYAWTAACLTLITLYRQPLRELASGRAVVLAGVVVLLTAALAGWLYGTPIVTSPRAANNLYRQQFQMQRFAADIFRGPVAVVDLGRVAYQNEYYVLDLWGLALPEALSARRRTADPAWMDALAEEQEVKVAMIYDFRFAAVPDSWIPVARLINGPPGATSARNTVTFYALDESTALKLRPLLEAFRPTLPPGASLEIRQDLQD